MSLSFVRVSPENEDALISIQNILKACGEDMFNRLGLEHWKNPYPIDAIRKNAAEREVYLIYDDGNEVGTLQLYEENGKLVLAKLGVLPECSGKGIGSLALRFMEERAGRLGLNTLYLDVYDKSEHAVNFYLHHGFEIKGLAPTRRFSVYLMEKKIT